MSRCNFDKTFLCCVLGYLLFDHAQRLHIVLYRVNQLTAEGESVCPGV